MEQDLCLTDFEKHIYNTHLKITRTRKNQPYKNRKEFGNVKITDLYNLKKIAIFLAKFSHIKVDEYIFAPYEVYPDETYFGLEYYTTLKAIKAYTLFQNKQIQLDPDSAEQLRNIVESLKYIKQFCTEKKIDVCDYIEHTTGNTPSYILHLKEHKVNVYSLLGFNSFEKNIKSVDIDLLEFILGDDFRNSLSRFRLKFFTSKKAKKLIEAGIQKIKQNNTLD